MKPHRTKPKDIFTGDDCCCGGDGSGVEWFGGMGNNTTQQK